MDEDMDCSDLKTSSNKPGSQAPVPSLVREGTLECAICLQPFIQPIQLPCSHTFCFLCAKGIALQRRPCALCRTDIPANFLSTPGLFQADQSKLKVEKFEAEDDRYVWYYQGHRGWWQYDDRTTIEIEQAYLKKEKTVDILIAGAIYIIDFENMVQFQRNMNSRKRKIKRDKVTAEKKGVAGMTRPDPSTSGSSPPAGSQSAGLDNTQARQLPMGASSSGAATSSSDASGDGGMADD